MRRPSLTAFLVFAAFVLAACEDGGATAVADPTRTATATVAATSSATVEASVTIEASSPTPTPAPTLSAADLDLRLREIEGAVVEIRGLEPGSGSARTLVSGEQIADRIAAELDEPLAVEETAREQRLLRLLGLLPSDAVLAEVYDAYLGSQVLGLYDPSTGELLVRADGDFDVLAEVSYAHEYVHELQDAHFGLLPLIEAAHDDRDAAAALSALIEGDASAAQTSYMLRHLDSNQATELMELSFVVEAELPPDMPAAVQAAIEFPYISGLLFALDLRASTGIEALDAAYADPPTTTEQILHPEKYLAREDALAVTLPDAALAGALGESWEIEDRSTLGELTLRSWLQALGLQPDVARRGAAGWGGDGYVVLSGEDGGLALAARIAWDDPDEAAQFKDLLTSALDGAAQHARDEGLRWNSPGGVLGVAYSSDGSIALAVAPTLDSVDALLDALG